MCMVCETVQKSQTDKGGAFICGLATAFAVSQTGFKLELCTSCLRTLALCYAQVTGAEVQITQLVPQGDAN